MGPLFLEHHRCVTLPARREVRCRLVRLALERAEAGGADAADVHSSVGLPPPAQQRGLETCKSRRGRSLTCFTWPDKSSLRSISTAASGIRHTADTHPVPGGPAAPCRACCALGCLGSLAAATSPRLLGGEVKRFMLLPCVYVCWRFACGPTPSQPAPSPASAPSAAIVLSCPSCRNSSMQLQRGVTRCC